MTIALVLWLQNGRKYGEVPVPDRGGVPWDYRLVVFDPPAAWRTAMYANPSEEVPSDGGIAPTRDVRFMLTECGDLSFDRGESWSPAAGLMYKLGRRRFHYLEPTGWTPAPTGPDDDNELMPPHVRDRIERESRVWKAVKKDIALLQAGAFTPRRDD